MGIFKRKPDIIKMTLKGNINGLIKALDNSDFLIRIEAANALERIAKQYTYNPLTVSDSISSMKSWAEQVMSRQHGKRPKKFDGDDLAISKLKESLKSEKIKDVRDAYRKAINAIKR